MTAVVRGENAFVNVDASSGTSGHSISRIGSELEALLSNPMDEDNDFNLIFDVGMELTSDAGIAPTAQTGYVRLCSCRGGFSSVTSLFPLILLW